jgi:hypothetical protein
VFVWLLFTKYKKEINVEIKFKLMFVVLTMLEKWIIILNYYICLVALTKYKKEINVENKFKLMFVVLTQGNSFRMFVFSRRVNKM